MRIWDLKPARLCRKHLLGEHRELHGLWKILTEGKKGYSLHPETLRWRGKLKALYHRHRELVKEMKRRHYNHNSPLDYRKATGSAKQDVKLHTIKQQKEILKAKGCECKT